MAFILDKLEDMENIYEAAKRVYDHEITAETAVRELMTKTEAKEATLKMYFNIYAYMRKGKCYKLGTSAKFTKYLLEQIYTEFGKEALKTAVSAAKLHSEYRASVNNEQPGIAKVCREVIAEKGIDLYYDDLPSFQIEEETVSMSVEDKDLLLSAIYKNNSEFSEILMSMVERYQIFDKNDIDLLCDRQKSRELFASEFAYLKEIDPDAEFSAQLKSADGRNRYYGKTYTLGGKIYVMTSHLYGLTGNSSHKNNRTPFYEWVLNKFNFEEQQALGQNYSSFGKFDSWEIIDENTAIKNCDKSFFEHNGSAIPKGICWFFDAENLSVGENRQIKFLFCGLEYTGRITNDTTDRRRVRVFWNADLGKQFSVYRDMDSVQALFKKQSANVYEIAIGGGEEELSVKDTVAQIKNYIAAKGFSYEDGLIENFYLSLKSKPFVILAGTSGTGKTRLVKLFAGAVGATAENGRYKMVSVRPDWSDSSDLFGHADLNGKFIPGAIIDFVKQAEIDNTRPYFLCLDEMNLARVEYYLSDILSVIETRDLVNGTIKSDPLISDTYYGSDTSAAGRYGTVRLPENLYIIGTVNMDETTFPFSRKVLDRANTIEFSYVDLIPKFDERPYIMPQSMNLSNAFLKTEYLTLIQCEDESETVSELCLELQRVNRILQEASAHVGYRVRDEIVFYLLNNKKFDLLAENEAMDNELLQKVFPRIQGSSASVKTMLCELFKFCAGDYDGYQVQSDNVSDKMRKALKDDNRKIKYRRSAEKLELMTRRFEEDGFTSYWL